MVQNKSKGTVLIIDDAISFIDIVNSILTNNGYHTITATSGNEGIKSAKNSHPDLILLDIIMPEKDGYDTIKELKHNNKTKEIPVMVMSTQSKVFDKVKAFNLGAVDYVTKPLNTEELLSRVNTQVSLYQLQEKLRNTNKLLEEEVKVQTKELRDSKEKYKTIADFTNDWEYWVLPNGKIKYMSPSCEKITGYTFNEFIENPSLINDIINNDNLKISDIHRNNSLNNKENSININFQIKTKSGELKWIGQVSQPVFDTENNYNGIRINNRDITDIKNTEEELLLKNNELIDAEEKLIASNNTLKEYNDKLRKNETRLIESQKVGHIGSWEHDLINNTNTWSDEIFRIFGYSPNEIKPSYEFLINNIHPDDRERMIELYKSSLNQNEENFEAEYRIKNNNLKDIVYVYDKFHHIRDKNNNVIHTIGMISDITKRKLTELKLKKYNDSLQQIIKSSSGKSGQEFFETIAKVMCNVTGSDYSFIGKTIDNNKIGTIAIVKNGTILNNFEYDLKNTPCENVIEKETCFYPTKVTEEFPNDQLLIDMKIDGYIGTPLFNYDNKCIGIIVSLYINPITDIDFVKSVFEILSGKITDEMERIKNRNKILEKNKALQNAELELNAANLGLKELILQVQENEERYRNLQENMPSGVVVYKPINNGNDFEIVGFNKAGEKISGIPKNGAIGNTIKNIIPGIKDSLIFKNIQEVNKTAKPITMNASKAYGAVNKRYTDNYIYKLPNNEIVVIFFDVTENILSEQKLIESENKFRTLAENTPGVTYLCNNDKKYSMLYLNSGIEKLTGYKKENFLSHKISIIDLFEHTYIQGIKEKIDNSLKKKEPFHLIYQIKTKNGELKWVEEYGVGIFNGEKLMFLEGSMMDITDRKNSELINNSRLRISDFALKNNAKQVLTNILDEAEKLTHSNIGFYHFINEDTEIITLHAWSTNTAKHFCKIDNTNLNYHISKSGVWADCIRKRKAIIHNSSKNINHDEDLHEWQANIIREIVVPVFRNNKIVAILGVGNKNNIYTKSDITILEQLADLAFETVLRKKAEEAIINEQSKNKNILEGTNAGMWEWNIQTGELELNDRWNEIIGYKKEEFPNNFGSFINSIHPDDLINTNKAIEKHFNNEIEYYDTVFRQKHKNGYWVWVNARGKITKWTDDGEPLIMNGTHLDITRQKEAEDRYKRLSEASFEGIAISIGGEIIDSNEQLAFISGYTPEEFTKLNLSELVHPDDMDTLMENIKLRNTSHHIIRGIKKDGSILYLELRANYIHLKGKEYRITAIRDITEQQKSQQTLIENEQQLQLIFDSSPAIMLVTNENGEVIKINKTGLQFLNEKEIKKEQIGDAFKCIVAIQSSGCGNGYLCNQCVIKNTIKNTIETGVTTNRKEANFNIVSKGKINKLNVLISVSIATQTPKKTYLITIDDVTEHKKAELKLINSEERFKDFANSVTDIYFAINQELKYIFCNKAFENSIGKKSEDILGKKFLDLEITKEFKWAIDELKKCMKTKKSKTFEFDYKTAKSKLFFNANIYPTKNGVIVYLKDITEQKLAQQNILQTIINTEEKERRRIAQELHDGLGPILSTVKLYTQSYLNSDNEKFKLKIEDQLLIGIDEALLQVSTISNNLSPHVLDDFGLKAAIERFIERIKNISNIQFNFSYNINTKPNKIIETTLYRVATELINNTIKYANASTIYIDFNKNKTHISLTFSDNGIGFDFEAVKDSKKGMGLFNIINRIKSLNGNVKFSRGTKKGINYNIKIPLE